MTLFPVNPGETPIDPSGLIDRTIRTRGRLNVVEAEKIRKATVKYLAKKPTKRQAKFDYAWALKLHREMFGEVWKWAGKLRTTELSIGFHPSIFARTSNPRSGPCHPAPGMKATSKRATNLAPVQLVSEAVTHCRTTGCGR